ncbi:MAG: hypothetical protein AAF253_05515 [Pseudomonadota bacterium]
MRRVTHSQPAPGWACLAMVLVLAACSAQDAPESTGADGASVSTLPNAALLDPSPADFVALPCVGTPAGTACAIVRAGGKTLLFGAPEGVHQALVIAGGEGPDGVFLFTLEGAGLEGLVRLRNQTWIDGRDHKLPVAGPDGTSLFLAYLDKGLERSDAVAYLRHRPAGRFDAALFAPIDVAQTPSLRVFDSGDLAVEAHPGADGMVHYFALYGGHTLLLSGCRMTDTDRLEDADTVIACGVDEAGKWHWPLAKPGVSMIGDPPVAVQQ